MRLLFASAVLALAACATRASSQAGATTAPVPRKLTNFSHFDVGSCAAPAPSLPEPLNPEVVVGALVLARPAVLECFVDPRNRGPDPDSGAAVKATVSELGAAFEVTGTNLTPTGVACIELALKRLPFQPLAKGTLAVSGAADFRHGPAHPQVKFGISAAADVGGTIRLAEPAWCDCWSLLGSKAPPSLRATLEVHPTGGPATEVSFVPPVDPAATALIACLTAKLAALPLVQGAEPQRMHYQFLLVNSAARTESADAHPELKFIQLALIRAQRAAEVAVKVGDRTNALRTYDALVAQYKARPDPKLVNELKDRCAAMVKSDEDWIASLQSQSEVDARSFALAQTLKAQDAQWTEAEAAAQAQLTASQTEVQKAEQVRTADQAVCPSEPK